MPAASVTLRRPLTKLPSLVTSGTAAVTRFTAAKREKTTEVIGGLSVANRNVCRTAPNESVAGSSEKKIAHFSRSSSFFLKK